MCPPFPCSFSSREYLSYPQKWVLNNNMFFGISEMPASENVLMLRSWGIKGVFFVDTNYEISCPLKTNFVTPQELLERTFKSIFLAVIGDLLLSHYSNFSTNSQIQKKHWNGKVIYTVKTIRQDVKKTQGIPKWHLQPFVIPFDIESINAHSAWK